MFDLKRPCANCPFRTDIAANFRLSRKRLEEIFEAPAFQCHKTVDYSQAKDDVGRQGDKPQQCAGLMALLHAEGKPNAIMQVAGRLIGYDPGRIETKLTFTSIADAMKAHE